MLHLGSIRGTTIDVDFNFGFLVLLFVVLNYRAEQGIHYALLWIPILFLSVLIHELAHAAMIGAFGFGSSQIVLTGMGGVTINRRRAKAWQDLFISLAGPVSSFGLYFLCLWIMQTLPIAQTDRMLAALLPAMAWANRVWGLFNLIPVPPLDGGHAVREFFRTFLNERTAFIISIWIAIIGGSAIAVLLLIGRSFFVALYIGWFVYMAFQQWQYFKQHGVPGD
ncbi:MAG TPA: M50 family metallopeptidase [Thermoanaerobaculia bacterium]